MTKIEQTHMALRLAGYGMPKKNVDLICRIQALIEEKGDQATIEDVVKIEQEIKTEYEEMK